MGGDDPARHARCGISSRRPESSALPSHARSCHVPSPPKCWDEALSQPDTHPKAVIAGLLNHLRAPPEEGPPAPRGRDKYKVLVTADPKSPTVPITAGWTRIEDVPAGVACYHKPQLAGRYELSPLQGMRQHDRSHGQVPWGYLRNRDGSILTDCRFASKARSMREQEEGRAQTFKIPDMGCCDGQANSSATALSQGT